MRRGLWAVAGVVGVGTVGYIGLGMTPLDALYQTVTTITTVGFREVQPLDEVGKAFTIVLILVGVGTALTTFTILLEVFLEGRLTDLFGRRRMERSISDLSGHVIVCGWGRVGRATATAIARSGRELVVIDTEAARIETVPHLRIHGDATDESVLRDAGLHRAAVVVAALNTDADNLYVTLTGRSLNPEIFIVARAREENAERRLAQAGADRVVNPQRIGGDRLAAFALQPHVAEFLDVVMHDDDLEFRLTEVAVGADGALTGSTLAEAAIRDRTGAMVLALRNADGTFHTNPPSDTVIEDGHVLIAIGTPPQLAALADDANGGRR